MKIRRSRVKGSKIKFNLRRYTASSSKFSNIKKPRSFQVPAVSVSEIRDKSETVDLNVENQTTCDLQKQFSMGRNFTESKTAFTDIHNILDDFTVNLSITQVGKNYENTDKANIYEKIFEKQQNAVDHFNNGANSNCQGEGGYENPSFVLNFSPETSLTEYLFERTLNKQCVQREENHPNSNGKVITSFGKRKFVDLTYKKNPFIAIENECSDEAKKILETTDVNSNGYSSLDVAPLCNNKSRVNSLLKYNDQDEASDPSKKSFIFNAEVTGERSVNIRHQIDESLESCSYTKWKVQWSTTDDFSVISGEKEINMEQKECYLNGLLKNQKYIFRVCLGNSEEYCEFITPVPSHLTPSSWHDIDGRSHRFAGRLKQVESLFESIHHPAYSQDTAALLHQNLKKRGTIKQLFTTSSKFQKHLRRGVYLACLLYNNDKILVTSEDFLPVIEIDETYPHSIYNDLHWFMKISCAWDNIKTLKHNIKKSNSSSTKHFRLKLLQAAIQMQNALCIQDLGQIYYKPFRDVHRTVVISTIQCIKSPKLVSSFNNRWLSLNKLTEKISTHGDSDITKILMDNIREQIAYHKLSNIKLSKGLYLGYFKMQSSIDSIQVVVPSKMPSSLPYCKIRDNPHISAEEWTYLKKITRLKTSANFLDKNRDAEEKENITHRFQMTEQARLFIKSLIDAAYHLFSYMNVSPENLHTHRLYDAEVIELSSEVSFLIIVPPVKTACLLPGVQDVLLQRDFLTLPIQVFEMIYLKVYQKDFVNCYSKLSCILELSIAQAQQNYREAFSASEVAVTRDKLTKLQEFQSQVNNVWKGARWLIDIITFARDKGSNYETSEATGIYMEQILSIAKNTRINNYCPKRNSLQLPQRDLKVVESSSDQESFLGLNKVSSVAVFEASGFNRNEYRFQSRNINTVNDSASTSGSHRNILSDHKQNYSDVALISADSEPTQSNNRKFSYKMKIELPQSDSRDIPLNQCEKSKTKLNNQSSNLKQSMIVITNSSQVDYKACMYSDAHLCVSTTSADAITSFGISESSTHNVHSLTNQHYNPSSSLSLPTETTSLNDGKLKLSNPASVAAITNTLTNDIDELKNETVFDNAPGILQVYAAYDTGLAAGTSLKLHVSPKTTAREVVDLVVKQLNMAVVLKGQNQKIYTSEELSNFCLVAVIGARERCLRDDFKPLQLQNPWKKGRLYVRFKQDVLAALEHSSKHTVYL